MSPRPAAKVNCVSAWHPGKVSEETNASCINNKNKNGGIHMLKKFKKQMKNEKGLTLIELLAVIVILAIIAAIAIPAIGNIINNSKDKAILAEASNIISGAKLAWTDKACATDTCTNLELEDFVDGVTLDGTTAVTKTADGWLLTFDKLNSDLKSKKFTIDNKVTSPITEKDLNVFLQK